MTPTDADRLKAQVEQMTWAQLLALWKWLTLVIYQRISKGHIYERR